MVTFGLILLAVLVLVAVGVVGYQMATSPFAWILHMAGGTLELLGKLLVLVLEAIADANR